MFVILPYLSVKEGERERKGRRSWKGRRMGRKEEKRVGGRGETEAGRKEESRKEEGRERGSREED